MLKYKSEQAINPNQWKKSLKELDGKDDQFIVHTATKFVEQLKNDLELLDKNKEVSDCALNSPRLYGSFDKKYAIGHKIALDLFPIDITDKKNNDEQKRKWSYIRYQRLLSRLSAAFKEQVEKEATLKAQFREVRMTCQRKYFCELKNRPISKLITDPTPMPVNVSSIEELQPFFDHLSNNTSLINIPQLEFKRGVQYDDGRMDLCKQVVGPPHIGKLMDSLKNNTQIKHFLLGNNIIGLNGANAIHDFILGNHSAQIKTWYLAGNEISSEGTKLICDALKLDTLCEALWLKRNPIKALGAKYIGEMLEVNSTIKILDLHNTGILDEGVKYLFQSLRKNTTLKHLYLDANGITEEGAKYISEYFDYLVNNNIKGITSLWIDMNRIDDNGMIIIANSLKNYKYLKRIFVGSNRLSDVSIKVLCDSLVDHPELIVFDLGLYKSTSDLGELPNNFGDKGIEYIAEFIIKNKSVKILSVLHNNLSIAGINILYNALLQNDSIVWLYYEQYGLAIPQEIRKAFYNKMEKNIMEHYNVTVSDFCDNKLRYIRGSYKLKNIDSVYRNRM